MSTTEQRRDGPDAANRAGESTAELVKRASEQVSQLVRDELALARTEMTAKARRAGTGAGFLSGAGASALYAVATLLATLILLLALVTPAWVAALIVSLALFGAAGVMALIGRGRVRRVGRPAPEQTVKSVRADLHAVSDAVKERGQR